MPKPVYKTKLPERATIQGRPCLLTKDREMILMDAIEAGAPLAHAAKVAGVCYETINRWRRRGETKSAPPEFRQFCQALKKARAKLMISLLSEIRNSGKKDWRANVYLLEKLFPGSLEETAETDHEKAPEGFPQLPPQEHDEPEAVRRMRRQQNHARLLTRMHEMLEEAKRERLSGAEDPPLSEEELNKAVVSPCL